MPVFVQVLEKLHPLHDLRLSFVPAELLMMFVGHDCLLVIDEYIQEPVDNLELVLNAVLLG